MMNDETKSMTIMKDSFLPNEEKWHFELQGYLVLDNIIPESDLKEMRSILNNWLTVEEHNLPPPLKRGNQDSNKTHIRHIHYGHKIFQKLNMNPEIIRIVAGLTCANPRLFHCVFTLSLIHI